MDRDASIVSIVSIVSTDIELSADGSPSAEPLLHLSLLVLLAGLGWYLSRLAYQTLGAGFDSLFLIVLGASYLPAVALLSRRRGRTAVRWVALVLLILGALPVRYSIRLHQLRHEAVEISVFAVDRWRTAGAFPEDLDGYAFRHARLREYLRFRSTGTRFGLHLAPSGNFGIGYSCGVDAAPPPRCIEGKLKSTIPDLESGPPPCSTADDWFYSND